MDSMASTKPQPAQLESVAVTFNGWTYEHGIQNRQEYQRVMAQEPSQKTLREHTQELHAKNMKLVRPSMMKLANEDGSPSATYPQYLVVGLAVLDPNDMPLKDFNESSPDAKKGEAVGHSITSGTIPTQHEPLTPLRVAVQISSALQSKTTFLALVDSGNNHCTPFAIPEHEVFFFKEFRSDETEAGGRLSSWIVTIRETALHGPQSADREELTIPAGGALVTLHRTSRLESLRTELVTTAALLRHDDNYHVNIAQLLRTLDELLPEIEKFPPPPHPYLGAFLNVLGHSTFTTQDSEGLVQELGEQWPDVRELIKAEDIYLMARGVRLTRTNIHPYSVRYFIMRAAEELSNRRSKHTDAMVVDGDDAIKQSPTDDVWLGEMVRKIATRAQEATGYQEPFNVSIQHDPKYAALIQCAANLDSIADLLDKYSRSILDQIGDKVAESTNIPDLIEEFKHCADQGMIRLFMRQAARILALNSCNAMSLCAMKIREEGENLRRICRRPSTAASQE